jgi:hypothetical protein
MTIADLLAISYLQGAESVHTGAVGADTTANGWTHRFSYPELPGCYVDSQSTTDGLRALERQRVAVILDMVVRGEPVPRPRLPLRGADPVGDLHRLEIDVDPDVLILDEAAGQGDPRLSAMVAAIRAA